MTLRYLFTPKSTTATDTPSLRAIPFTCSLWCPLNLAPAQEFKEVYECTKRLRHARAGYIGQTLDFTAKFYPKAGISKPDVRFTDVY